MDLATLEQYLRKTEQNVARCQAFVAKQVALIAKLDGEGMDTSFAKETLEILRRAQHSHEKQRDRYANLLHEAKTSRQ